MSMIPSKSAAMRAALALSVLATSACYYEDPPPRQYPPYPNNPANPGPGFQPFPGTQPNPDNDGRYGPGQASPDGQYQPDFQPPPPTDNIPVARRTDNPNRVISPHPPYNVVDITGFKSGELARDPTIEDRKIFRVP